MVYLGHHLLVIKEGKLPLTRVWQKWRFSAPQTHLWLIKVWFSASTFVVKIATFAKPETVTYPPSINGNMRFTPHPMIIAINTIMDSRLNRE